MGSTSRSTNVPVVPAAAPDWRAAGLRYYTLSFFYGKRFGCRVHKIPVDGGFGCPNRDGTLGWGGCIFCDPASFSPARRGPRLTIARQIAAASDRLRHRYRAERFVAYFQPGTNTYAPVDRLRAAYEEAVAQPGVVGLSVGTRPDCVPDQVLDLLAGFGRRTWVSIEYGLQTIHRRTLARINRGHGYECFADAVARSRARGLAVGAHVILGLPGETPDDMAATARQLGRLEIDLVKIHNLHAVRGTRLADMVADGQARLPELSEYAGWAVDFLENLWAGCVVDRLSGDVPPEYLVGPPWCRDKAAVRAAIEAELLRRDTWQGRRAAVFSPGASG